MSEAPVVQRDYTKANKALSKAKINLMQMSNTAFYISIAFSLKYAWDDSIPSAGTNGIDMVINPDWFLQLSPDERVGLICHEVMHVALQHMCRTGIRDPEIFNEAADHVINNLLKDANITIPSGGACDPQYRGKSTEEVYTILHQNPPPNSPPSSGLGTSPNDGSGYDKDIMPLKGDQEQIQEQEAKIAQTVAKASMESQMQGDAPGTVPGDAQRLLDNLFNPKLPWNVLLQNYMTAFAKDDYSFSKPNKRFMPDFYLPGLHSEGLGEICVAIDTSGSVSDHDFKCFMSEVTDIKQSMSPSQLTIIDFDTSIKNVYNLSKDEGLDDITFSGYGGTNLKPVFDYYKDKSPEVLIVFSDLYCTAIQNDPGYPVLWVVIDNPEAEVFFGDKIDYSTRQ